MRDASEEIEDGDMDHRLGDVDAGFVVADRPSPLGHPSKDTIDSPVSREDFEAQVDAADDLDHKVEAGSLVQELAPVIGAVPNQ